jgi:hypothetical protein
MLMWFVRYTLRLCIQTFRIKSLRSTRDGNKSAYDIVCHLINQRGKVCFRAEKVERLLYSYYTYM